MPIFKDPNKSSKPSIFSSRSETGRLYAHTHRKWKVLSFFIIAPLGCIIVYFSMLGEEGKDPHSQYCGVCKNLQKHSGTGPLWSYEINGEGIYSENYPKQKECRIKRKDDLICFPNGYEE